ncbi:N-6 DNA methylase [Dehalococcoidia bacterium]|nr:N-6 DNA methylase [Dehalococcoidia bacterium]
MKKPKLSGKERMPSPFEPMAYKVERSAVAVLMHWMRGIIEQKALDLGLPDVETYGPDGKSPDLVIYESRRSQNVLCVIEAKLPHFDVFDYENLKEPARGKATRRGAKYFATTNFRQLIWFNTEKVNAQMPEEEQVVDKYHLSELENLGRIEETRYKESITRQLEAFLVKLYAVYTEKEPEPKQAVDEFLIYRLHSKINTLSRYYTTIIDNRCHKDDGFAAELGKWFVSQGWSFVWQRQDFDKAARQTAYLLVNKILFYNVLQAKRPHQLAPLEIPRGLFRGAQVQKILQSFFDELLKIDYETIYTTDFIDVIAFPDEKEVVKEIKELVNVLRQYDFSRLGDVIGPIFERLIPRDERHNLGQYFTNDDVVDIILKFCLRYEDDKLLDPACGAGTFLVSAYRHKKLMNQRLGHEDILDTLWGNDIAKFPAHLATINLAIRDLGVDKNYPNILQEDFFTLLSTEGGFELPAKSRQAIAMRLDMKEREVTYPRWFDCIVGNPPYTRQEEMREIAPQVKEYKGEIIERALRDNTGRRIAEISKRAGIHAYFFVHGMKFLRDGGRFGFIVSNSWLDVDYGKGLQEFFLNNYKIIAVVESKVERWFEEADINTCIVILEKCRDKKKRDGNLVRFVYLFQPLRHFIPPAQDMWQQQVERLNEIGKLIKTILAHSEFYQNEELRIFPISQAELWEEGFDKEEGTYVGAKWGKYIRAPAIFFKILEKGKGKLVPLKEVAEVRRGFTTGANAFFYLTEEEINRRGIEREFWMHQDNQGNWVPNYVIKSPRECKSIVVKPGDLKYRVLMIHKDKKDLRGTKVLRYIRDGERKGYHLRPTCTSRQRWYDLGDRKPHGFLHPMIHNDRQLVGLNEASVYVDHNLFEIQTREKNFLIPTFLFFASSVAPLIKELGGRVNLGEGALKTEGIDIEKLLTIRPSALSKQQIRSLEVWLDAHKNFDYDSLFSEFGVNSPEEVSLDKVKPDRRELDKIVMGEILGLTDEEQLEVYRAVVDLVRSRIEKARSFGKKRKTKEGIDIDLLVKTVMETLGEDTLGKFYREKVLSRKPLVKRTLPPALAEIRLEQDLFGWRLSWGRQHLACTSEPEARYLKVWMEAGLDTVKVPKDEDCLKAIVPELEALKQKTDEVFENYLGSILDPRTRQRLLHQLWREVMK